MRGLHPEQDLQRALDRQVAPHYRRRWFAGGKVEVPPSATIAVPGACWCGRDYDHEWVGKEDGAPHPRYPE